MTSLAAALAAAALVSTPQAPAVAGVIRSSDGGRPVAYAQVRVLNDSIADSIADWTSDLGEYALQGLPRGRWAIRVLHANHDPLEIEVFVPGDRTVRLDVTLEARPGPEVDALSDFEPFQVAYTLPALLNELAVRRMIEQRYPRALIERGVGGEAVLRLWLDERGQVVRSMLSSSSGAPALDSIALEVSDEMRFRPAKNRGEMVRVIVRIPVTFTVPDSALARPPGEASGA